MDAAPCSCRAYLLMEMDTVRLEPKRWCIWLCQPQTFVTLCLARRFSSRRFKVVGAAFFVLLWLQTVADLLSVAALWGLLAPPAPAGLAHGAGGLILGYVRLLLLHSSFTIFMCYIFESLETMYSGR
eukprot:COSAG02_NODE_14094_length_1311_cov_1.302805_3_plen_127_part_00